MMKIRTPLNAILGIVTEVLYTLSLVLAAFLICLALYFRR
jgi:hypothetical protein